MFKPIGITEPKSAPPSINRHNPFYDSGSLKVTLFAGMVIVFSMLLIGTLVYFFTEKEAVNKLKTKDLDYIAESIASKIDGELWRARETSLVLANDPETVRWVEDSEKDPGQSEHELERLDQLVKKFGYSNSFIVSALTRHYWGENKKLLGAISPDNPNDAWFYKTLADNKPVTVVLDYNEERDNTFIFVNALLYGMEGKPIAVTGVGLSLEKLSDSFESYKYGANSSIWLIDGQGKIYLSDRKERDGQNIRSFLPEEAFSQILDGGANEHKVIDFTDAADTRYDLISRPITSTDWRLVVQIPRSETVGFLRTIKINTAIAIFISIISIVFFFLYVSRKLANPYKRVLQLNTELEKQVALRTKELALKNENIMDSIAYAKRIQESILPEPGQLEGRLADHFVLWKPRDIVGGDFYWFKSFPGGTMVAVGDCTGHGVPGAFMTMLTVSALNQIADSPYLDNPGQLLSELNQELKRTLHQVNREGLTDDGLDIGLCCISADRVMFAGARCSLYIHSEQGLRHIRGARKSVGYRRTPLDYEFANNSLPIGPNATFYMSTDGFIDQNGGPKDYSFGRGRFASLIEACGHLPLAEQKIRFEQELEEYMGGQTQRDDIAVFAFRTSVKFWVRGIPFLLTDILVA
jgi:serine phosphatase RsbU (regulator of sigma subunit)